MKAYLTQSALTSGIHEVACELDEANDRIKVISLFGSFWVNNEGIHWHRTLAGAVERAEKMRQTRLASLRKQLERIEKLDFSKVKK